MCLDKIFFMFPVLGFFELLEYKIVGFLQKEVLMPKTLTDEKRLDDATKWLT